MKVYGQPYPAVKGRPAAGPPVNHRPIDPPVRDDLDALEAIKHRLYHFGWSVIVRPHCSRRGFR